jgi:putative ABC transport system substrate-binding protein
VAVSVPRVVVAAGCLVLVLLAGLLPAPPSADAQKSDKVYRIGYMSIPSRQSAAALIDRVFLPALRERGLIAGKNLVIEWRWADGKAERLAGFAAELVALKVDLIVAPQSDSALMAKRATRSIPIVHIVAGDPIADGLVKSLSRPEGNVTGLTSVAGPEIDGKRLELLKAATGASRIAVLTNPARRSPTSAQGLKQAEAAARTLGVRLQMLEARSPEQFEPAFTAMTRGRSEAVLVSADSMFWLHRQRLAELEVKHRVPASYGLLEHVEAGGLMSYGVDLSDLFRRSTVYIDRILKGAKPADLPIERPTKFSLAINLKTARALGLAIPPSLLLQADRVVE